MENTQIESKKDQDNGSEPSDLHLGAAVVEMQDIVGNEENGNPSNGPLEDF